MASGWPPGGPGAGWGRWGPILGARGIEIRRGDQGEFANEKKTFSRRKKGGGNSADFSRAATGKSGGQESAKGNLAKKNAKEVVAVTICA